MRLRVRTEDDLRGVPGEAPHERACSELSILALTRQHGRHAARVDHVEALAIDDGTSSSRREPSEVARGEPPRCD